MNFQQAKRIRREPFAKTGAAALLLTAGGDERIRIDPATGRNRYATTATPRPHEIFLSSSTASTISPRAYRAVESAWEGLSAGSVVGHAPIETWFDEIRARLLSLFGIDGSDVILTGSGTETELIALAIAKSLLPGPLANIVLAPAETGSGVLRAAAGAHFLGSTPFGEGGRPGEPLRGWADADVEVAAVEIRDCAGNLRPAAAVDAEARDLAHAALDAGRNVLLHRLETSKTGRSGLTVAAAVQLAAGAPDRVVVVVDCCQLRCSRRRVRQYLAHGFMVAITGSKFFGGPPFSGALLVPPPMLRRIGRLALPDGLADYSSRQDWPANLRAKTQLPWANEANLGLGLRWVAALEEMERFYATPAPLRRAVLTYFEKEIRKRSQHIDHIHEIGCRPDQPADETDTILSFVMTHPDGAPFSLAETAAIHARLRQPCPRSHAGSGDALIFHLGQPVAIGARTALRVCASAPLVSDIAERIVVGESIETAFVGWVHHMDLLFAKWRQLMAETPAGRHPAPPIQRDVERAL